MVLGIYGVGGLGREFYELALDIDIQGGTGTSGWEQIVFVADYADTDEIYGVPILTFGAFQDRFPVESSEIVIAVGEPQARAKLRDKVESNGYPLATMVHPTARLSRWAVLGRGCVVTYGCNISMANIGKNVCFQPFCSAGHDSNIGEDCVISAGSRIAGSCSVGERTYIGLQSAVRERVRIGRDVIVGMGSCVQRDIESGMIALGNPARVIRKNENQKVF